MNISKKLITVFFCFGILFSSSLYAHNGAHTFYGGYIFSKITGHSAHGTQLSYRYESDNTWGLLTSLLYINSNHKENFIDDRFQNTSKLKQKHTAVAILIGPTYRINSSFSVFIQMGPVKLKYKENKYHPTINTTDTHTVSTSNYIAQGGVDYNPLQNLSINMGYIYSNATVNKRRLELSGVQLSLGYRF